MTRLPFGLDLEGITRAADAARHAPNAIFAAGRVHHEMMEAVQRAAEAVRFIPPNVPALGLIAPDFSALRFLPPELPSVAAHLQTVSAHIQAAFRDGFAKFALEWKEVTERLPARVRDALQVLGEHGWYPDDHGMTFPDILDFADALAHGDAEEAHERLCQHFEERMDEVLEDVVTNFPNRAKVVRSAFAAHRRGEYELSVPALLAQTDGICKEVSGVQLCGRRRKDGRLRMVAVVESWKKSDLSKAMLHPLLVVLPIAFNEDERDGRAGILNRHAVLHGEDVTYDSRRNGCRAISLLGYVASILREREPEEDAA